MKKSRVALSRAAFACAGLLTAAYGKGAVALVSETGPLATFSGTTSNPVNFTTEGTAAWVYFPLTTGNGNANPADEKKTNATAFTIETGVAPTGLTALGSSGRTGGTASGVTAAVTTTAADSSTVTLTSLPGYTYYSPSAAGYGGQSTYNMPAGSTEVLSVYCYTLSSVSAKMTLTETDGSSTTTLYSDASNGVELPQTQALTTKDGGVYRFTLQNSDSVNHLITFAYTVAGFPIGVTSGQIGMEGITAMTTTAPAAASPVLTVSNSGTYDLQSTNATVGGISDGGQSGASIGSSATGQQLTLTVSPVVGTTNTFSGVISDNLAGGSGNMIGLTFSGQGTQVLSGSNTYSGPTTIGSGTLQLGSNNTLPVTTQLGFAGTSTLNLNSFSQTVGGLNLSNGLTANIVGGTLAIGSGTILIDGNAAATTTLNGALSISGATIDASAISGTSSGYNIVINSQITGTGGLTIKGIGATADVGGSSSVLTLNNTSNNFTGGVNIASGSVNIADGDGIFGNGTVASTNTVTIASGAGIENAGISTVTVALNSNFVLNGGGAHYFRAYTSTVTSINSAITDAGTGASLYKTDAGLLVLAGQNTYTGLTQVNDGSVLVTGNESAATGGWAIGTASQFATTVNFSSGSTINVSSGNAITVGTVPGNTASGSTSQILNVASPSVTDAGALTIGSFSAVNLSSGAVWNQLGAMSIQSPNNSTTGTATLIISPGAVFNYNGTSAINLTPALNSSGGAAGLQISGGTFNTSQGFANAAYFKSPASSNSSAGSANISLTNGGTLGLLNDVPSLTSTNGSTFNLTVGSGAGGIINTNGYNTAIGTAISNNAPNGVLTKSGAGMLTLSATNTYTGGTNAAAGTLILASSTALPANANAGTGLIVALSAQLTIADHGTNPAFVAQVSTLTNNGTIDITTNAMVLRNASTTAGTIWTQIQQSYNNGAWNGTNTGSGVITSSTAAGDSTHLTAVGVATGLTTTFEGLSVSPGDVLVKYTYYGDADLDGQVTSADYTLIDAGYLSNGSLTGWQNGDFNYDSVVNGSDYTLIDNAFNTQGAQLSSEIAASTAQIAGSGTTSAVPEPASLGLIALSGLGLLGRRRRK